jgi:hypothetical protein
MAQDTFVLSVTFLMVMLSVVLLNVIMLNVVILSSVAPYKLPTLDFGGSAVHCLRFEVYIILLTYRSLVGIIVKAYLSYDWCSMLQFQFKTWRNVQRKKDGVR